MSFVDLIFNRNQGLDGILRIESPLSQGPSAHIVISAQIGAGATDTPTRPPLDVNGRYVYAGFMTENPSAANGFRPQGRWVAVKVAIGREDVASFRREVLLYHDHLAPLQGDVVPALYGAWESFDTDGGDRKHHACMVLEWCSGDMTEMYKSSDELYQDLMVAICKLHHAGVVHTKLLQDGGRDIVFGKDNSVRFIDFSMASIHKCPGISIRWSPDGHGKVSTGCPELVEVGECPPDVRRYFNMIKKVSSKHKARPSQVLIEAQSPVVVSSPLAVSAGGDDCAEW